MLQFGVCWRFRRVSHDGGGGKQDLSLSWAEGAGHGRRYEFDVYHIFHSRLFVVVLIFMSPFFSIRSE